MSKLCVFCGNKPESKTKEHIIPKWLIELTGNSKRPFIISSTLLGESEERTFAADQFTFPACESCNNSFSELEGNVQLVYQKLKDYQYIDEYEIQSLLDWLDKVRVGLWLGYSQLDKNPMGILPKFYINNRVGQSDRSLYISDLGSDWHGINFMLANLPVFYSMPSTMLLRIENLLFLSISNKELNARRMGFPYHSYTFMNSNIPEYINEFEPGLSRIMNPIIDFVRIRSDLELHQTVNGLMSKRNDAYTLANTYDGCKSKILYGVNGEYKFINGFNLEKIMLDDYSSGLKYRASIINGMNVQLQVFVNYFNNLRAPLKTHKEK